MELLLLGADDLRTALPMRAAIETAREALVALANGTARVPARLHLDVAATDGGEGGTLLTMPAHLPGVGLGAKLVSVYPGNARRSLACIQGLVVLLDESTGAPAALCDGAFLTAWRTGAASGAATDALARPDARTAAVLGSGPQARTQVLAIDAVRTLDEVRVFSRRPERVAELVRELQPDVRARLVAAASARAATDGAHVVCTATDSRVPVLEDAWIHAGCHVNAIGSFTPDMCELPIELVERARVFVDSRAAARTEAGELIAAVEAGRSDPASWTELGACLATRVERAADEVTLFDSVGSASQDLAAGARALARARELGLGQRVSF